MKRIFVILLFIFLLSGIAFSEVTGNITLGALNITAPPTTGLFGYTIQYCNITANCIDITNYKCFLDYDSISSGTWQGWCNLTSITNCYHNSTAYATGTKICDTTTSYRTCSSSTWSASTSCGVNETCSNGNCSSTTTTTTTTGGTTTTTTNVSTYSSIKINKTISDFDMVQNTSTSKNISVKNDGNTTLTNLTVSLSGIDSSWFSISPTKHNYSYKNTIYNFTINFSVPYNAEVKTYTVTITATTSNTSVTDTKSFSLKVLPSNETVEEDIKPKYNEYLSMLESLKNNITDLETKGANVTELISMYGNIEAKLNQTNSSIASKDYYNAKTLLNEIKTLIDNLKNKISETQILPKAELPAIDIVLIIIVIVIIAIVLFLAYLFWPTKEERGFRLVRGWKPEIKKEGFGGKFSGIFGRKEKQRFFGRKEGLEFSKSEKTIAQGISANISKIFKKKKKKEKGAFKYEFKK